MSNLGSGPASVGGHAQRISAADKLAQAVSNMQSQGGTLTAEITITRAATGAVEHHTLTFTPLPEEQQQKDAE